ncbi:rRNA N-glycosidase [Rhynchospora pubera]|uniref:rRNA N-glycosylase n=1 Tax=Rhynchospora pubera TaxID=906938 RepID=A0AAV8HFF8_9POAL|nr:rRNA N-glycosidase [Rhynchospora pubera]
MAPPKRSSEKTEVGEGSSSRSSSAKTRIARFPFKVTNKSGYKDYIYLLRKQFVSNQERYGIPILPEETPPNGPDDFIEAHLQTEEGGVVLLIRRDNAYVVGFKSENSEVYYEFVENSKLVIPSSIPSNPLWFSGNYNVLEPNLDQLSFSEGTMRQSIDLLAKYKSKNDRKNACKSGTRKKEGGAVKASNVHDESYIKREIAKLVISISEAIRFERVAAFVSDQLNAYESKTLGSMGLDEDIVENKDD